MLHNYANMTGVMGCAAFIKDVCFFGLYSRKERMNGLAQ